VTANQGRSKSAQFVEWLNVIDRIESKHPLVGRAGFVSATTPFLSDLRDALGVTSVTQAWAIWKAATDWRNKVQERYADDADLAFWYSVDPFSITPEQRAGLLANLPRCKAQKRINEGNFDIKDPEAVYELFLVATGDESQALKARGDAIEANSKTER
jgi:hypothetical protein